MFRKLCEEEGKELYVWTVNDRRQMIQAIKWGAAVVLTDRTADYLNVRGEASSEFPFPCLLLFLLLLPIPPFLEHLLPPLCSSTRLSGFFTWFTDSFS